MLSRGLFAGNYTETHYLEDGGAVTASHNVTVCFKLLFCFSASSGNADTVNLISGITHSAALTYVCASTRVSEKVKKD